MEITVKFKFEKELVEDLIETALEGGSNYWYLLSNKTIKLIKEYTPNMEGEPFSLRLVKAINQGMHISINDAENSNEVLGKIHTPTIERALVIMFNDYNENFENIRTGNFDIIDADIFFQLAVIGRVDFD